MSHHVPTPHRPERLAHWVAVLGREREKGEGEEGKEQGTGTGEGGWVFPEPDETPMSKKCPIRVQFVRKKCLVCAHKLDTFTS